MCSMADAIEHIESNPQSSKLLENPRNPVLEPNSHGRQEQSAQDANRLTELRLDLKKPQPNTPTPLKTPNNEEGNHSDPENKTKIIISTFSKPEDLSFETRSLDQIRNVSGVNSLVLRSASLGGNKDGKYNLNPDRNILGEFDGIIVIDSEKIRHKAELKGRSYPKELNKAVGKQVRSLAMAAQLDKVKGVIYEEHTSQLSTTGFEEVIRKTMMTMGTLAAPVGIYISLFPKLAESVIENTAKYQFGITGLEVNSLAASAVIGLGGICLSEVYDYVAKKFGIGNHSPILFHRIATTYLMTGLNKIVKPRHKTTA